MPPFINLYDAKTRLSSLVDRTAAGKEIVVAKNGVPHARLVPIVSPGDRRTPANAMLVEYVSPDFDASDPVVERLFAGETE